jgi:hypothetical protein
MQEIRPWGELNSQVMPPSDRSLKTDPDSLNPSLSDMLPPRDAHL